MSKQNQNIDTMEPENGESLVHRSRRGNIVAAILSLLLAVVIWAVVMNAEDTTEAALAVVPVEGYTCTLSVDSIEIKGKILDIKRVETVKVAVSEELLEEGTHPLGLEHLTLPEGVVPASAVEITLTVTKKAP